VRLSKKGEYAIKALQYFSLNRQKEIVRISEISEKEKIPLKFLEQILLSLKKSGILQSKLGLKGGYKLARPPEKLSLGEILRIIDGPVDPVECIREDRQESCQEEGECSLRLIMMEIKEAISQILDRITLQELCNRSEELRKRQAAILDYQI